MVLASQAGWQIGLHTASQIASTILLIELGVVLLIVCFVMGLLVYGVWWLRHQVVPILGQYAPIAQQAMTVTQEGSDRVVHGIAEFYGRREAVRTGLRVLLFGKGEAQRVHEEAVVHAAAQLDLMATPEQEPAPENGFTPQLSASEASVENR